MLQQIQNVSSYAFLHEKLEADRVHVNALWFDIYTGDLYMFSRTRERFVSITKETYEHLVKDGESTEDKILSDEQGQRDS